MTRREETHADNLLISVGIYPNKRAYGYIKYLISENEKKHLSLGYKRLSDNESTPVGSIERDIRAAIKTSFEQGKLQLLNSILNCNVCDNHNKPTTQQLINLLSNALRLKHIN